MAEPAKTNAWRLFDEVVRRASLRATNPWRRTNTGEVEYEPDDDTLRALLGVPLFLGARSQSGIPALALDVWVAYELRRAGFGADAVWPREVAPRVLPGEVSTVLAGLPSPLRRDVQARIAQGQIAGLSSASANLLGKNYVKQVDVVMSSWQTGPELMISTKRMDSSFGKNAANRVEESYGDAKNLRLRHPQAALGFFYSLRSTALTQEPDVAAWIIDLLGKLGREDDAYDAVGLIVPEWGPDGAVRSSDVEAERENPLMAAGLADAPEEPSEATAKIPDDIVVGSIAHLPQVRLRPEAVPAELLPARFLRVMAERVLANSPVNFHAEARKRRGDPRAT